MKRLLSLLLLIPCALSAKQECPYHLEISVLIVKKEHNKEDLYIAGCGNPHCSINIPDVPTDNTMFNKALCSALQGPTITLDRANRLITVAYSFKLHEGTTIAATDSVAFGEELINKGLGQDCYIDIYSKIVEDNNT